MNSHLSKKLLLPLLLLCTACAITEIEGSWVNPEYQGEELKKILILGVSDNESYRRHLEDSLSKELAGRNIKAIPGYTLFPQEERPSREIIAEKIRQQGFDSMLISRVTGKTTEEEIYPGGTYFVRDRTFGSPAYNLHWYNYYTWSYDVVRQRPYVIGEHKVVTVETNVYDAVSDKLIWSANSETVFKGKMNGLIDSLVDTLIEKLREDRVI